MMSSQEHYKAVRNEYSEDKVLTIKFHPFYKWHIVVNKIEAFYKEEEPLW